MVPRSAACPRGPFGRAFVRLGGDSLVVDNERQPSEPQDAMLHVFEVDWTENRLLERRSE